MSVYVEQEGYTVSFRIVINGDENTPQPAWHEEIIPNFRGLTVSGIPKYQGPVGMIVGYDSMTIGKWQFWTVAFFPGLNSGEGPTVTVYMPNPNEAGRFVTYDGILLWPERGRWEKGLIQSTKMTITRLVQRED